MLVIETFFWRFGKVTLKANLDERHINRDEGHEDTEKIVSESNNDMRDVKTIT